MKQIISTVIVATLAMLGTTATLFAAPQAKSSTPLSKNSDLQRHTAYYGSETAVPKVPSVMLSMQEDALCKLKPGQTMPTIELPKLDGGNAKLSGLLGKKATVVVFWKDDHRMTAEELADLGPDVVERFGKDGVEVICIAVDTKPEAAKEALNKSGAKFTTLLDADGNAFAQVGKEALPRTFVLDSSGKIAWFDISYTLATRREIRETLRALTGDSKEK
ncbi:MAG TPA: TlpA disulfide reductase family protein [Lacipirellulaceae bacterium]|jgi:peroxiredoxin|nr:TlpA disulfide reductase family protein [Lacipirellulaceae bacterium]